MAVAAAVVIMMMIVVVVMMVVMLMGMGNTVMGMLMGVDTGSMIVGDMHRNSSFGFFLYYIRTEGICQSFYFFQNNPRRGLRNWQKKGIIHFTKVREVQHMSDHFDHDHSHDHTYLHAHGIAHTHGHVHENQKAVINRLSRAIGHLNKVKTMVEEGYDCSEVLIQLAAVRSALDNTGKVILKDHMRHCMVDAVAAGDENAIEDLCEAVDKFMK